ncbi:MAG: thioredoxin family protein [Sphingobacteriaceae bacterium]|nr:thioredoxin family protein [Sphingobacteriaceae bacterium]
MKKLVLFFILSAVLITKSQTAAAQIKNYSFEQLDSLQSIEKRNVMVFIHTHWCKYCQLMQNSTFKNQKIIQLINSRFYFISLDAEETRSLVFNKQVFKYQPTGKHTGSHQLAQQLASINQKTAYPTLCFLNPANEIIFQYPQYANAKDLEKILDALLQ